MNQILLVEGNDDQHVIWALCRKFDLPQNFEVVSTNGVDRLFNQLPIRLKGADVKTIGIIIDADTNIEARWNTVKTILKEKYMDFPDYPNQNGTIFQDGNSKAGVWLMPDNQVNEMLESFINFLIPPTDELRPILNTQLDNIERENLNKYNLIHRDKAFIHSWLAIQEDPGTPMGLSITKKYLNTDADRCQLLVNWLRNLFK